MKCVNCGEDISNYVNKCKHCKNNVEPNYEFLVNQAMNKDKKAQEALYNFNYKSAYFVALKMAKNEDDAMDMVQDSFLKAFSSLDKLSEPNKFPSWLGRITANICRDYFKKRRHDFFEDIKNSEDENIEYQIEDFDGIIPSNFAEDKDVQRIIRNIIDNLPDDQRLCVLMFYYDNLSVHEIAETLGISEGTVKSRLNYARKKMKVEIERLSEKGTDLRGISIGWLFKWCLNTDEKESKIPKGLLTFDSSAASGLTVASATTAISAKIVAGIISAIAVITGGFVVYYLTNQPESIPVDTTVDSQYLKNNMDSSFDANYDSFFESKAKNDTSNENSKISVDSLTDISSGNTFVQSNNYSDNLDNNENAGNQADTNVTNTENTNESSINTSNSQNSADADKENDDNNDIDNDPSSYTYTLSKIGDSFLVFAQKPGSNELFIIKSYSEPAANEKDDWAKSNFEYDSYDELVTSLPIELEYKSEYNKNF